MKTVIVGAGYVGLVTGVTLAEQGHHVTFVDVDGERVAALRQGRVPFREPGLEPALQCVLSGGGVSFTTSLAGVAGDPEVVFICVPTPADERGVVDLAPLDHAVRQLAQLPGRQPLVLAIKSTVPVGTHDRVTQLLARRDAPAGTGDAPRPIHLASLPEFLREGSALADSRQPDRIVIGTRDPVAAARLQELYRPVGCPILCVEPRDAELIKYAANAFLALKISFANALADFCEVYGADVSVVTAGVGLDRRIGPAALGAGLGFGGSCLPKDLRSLIHQFQAAGVPAGLLEEAQRINAQRIERVVGRLRQSLGDLRGRCIALLGLAYKPHTDDVRESQSLRLLRALLAAGCEVNAFDPWSTAAARRQVPEARYCPTAAAAVEGADAVVLATEWPQFEQLNWPDLVPTMRGRLVVDCRNRLRHIPWRRLDVEYAGMGVST